MFIKELSVLYADFSVGKSSSLTNLPLQYADFAHWQRQWLDGDRLRSQLSYWQQQLDGTLPPLKLPFEKPQSSQPISTSYKGEQQSVELSPDLTASLKALSDRFGVTLFTVLLGAFNLLLYQYTRQEDIIICSTQAGRNLPKIQDLIGFFNNIVFIRTDLSGNPSFLEVINRIHYVALDAYRYQDIPLQLLAESHISILKGTSLTRNQVLENWYDKGKQWIL